MNCFDSSLVTLIFHEIPCPFYGTVKCYVLFHVHVAIPLPPGADNTGSQFYPSQDPQRMGTAAYKL